MICNVVRSRRNCVLYNSIMIFKRIQKVRRILIVKNLLYTKNIFCIASAKNIICSLLNKEYEM